MMLSEIVMLQRGSTISHASVPGKQRNVNMDHGAVKLIKQFTEGRL